MNTPGSNPDPSSRWDKLLNTARADAAPPVDVAALQRVVRNAELPARATWADEFVALFASRRALPAFAAATLIVATLTTWEVADLWAVLPWAQLLASTGGAP